MRSVKQKNWERTGNQKKGNQEKEKRKERTALLDVKGQQRQIQNQGDPVSVDQEQCRQESVNGSFRDDVRVEAVA